MGTRYSTTSVTGFNSGPPADDGSQTASNQVKWSTIKTKLADPLNTFASAIDGKIVTALDFGSRQVTGADTTTAADHMKTVEIASTVSSTITVSLGDAAAMTAGYIVTVKNSSAVNQTVGRITAGDKIDGVAANVTLAPKGAATFKVANTASEGYLTTGSLTTYEEGTWIPSIGGSATYTQRVGTYVKVGKMVTVSCYLFINAVGTGDVNTVSGLPFTVAVGGQGAVGWFNGIATSVVFLVADATAGATTVEMRSATAAQASIGASAIFANSAEVKFTLSYFV